MESRKFSVIIPLYNREKIVSQSLASVLEQSHPPYEIIICDDGSTDSSTGIAENYLAEKSTIKWKIVKIENSGPSFARKVAVENSTGDYLLFLDSDDLWRSDYIKEINQVLDSYPEINVTVSNFKRIIDKKEENKSKFDTAPKNFWKTNFIKNEAGYLSTSDFLFVKALEFQPCFASCLGCSRRIYEDVGGFKLKSRKIKSEDAHLIRRLYYYGNVLFIKSALVNINIHTGNRSNNDDGKLDYTGKLKGKIDILKMMKNEADINSKYGPEIENCIESANTELFDFYYWEQQYNTARKLYITNKLYMNLNIKLFIKFLLSFRKNVVNSRT